MIAYHGKQEVKDLYLNRVRAHRVADELVKGFYWEDGKGCAVGCTIHGDDHAAYEAELGIPVALARLEDYLFERLPNHLAMEWPEKFLAAIKPGADLSLVGSRFLHWLLVDPADGVIRFADSDRTRAAVQGVADLHARRLKGEEPTESEWKGAKDAADAAYYAAGAAYYAADAAAARAAAVVAYDAAASAASVRAVNAANAATNAATNAAACAANAARATYYAANVAYYAARAVAHAAYNDAAVGYDAAHVRQSEKLIELLEAA